MIIAVDFDGTLCKNEWPKIGEENTFVIRELRRRQKLGDKIILWTCRTGGLLEIAVDWCTERGLIFDAINDNLPEMKEKFGGDCRKIFANEYWDDRNVLVYQRGMYKLLVKKPGIFGIVRKKCRRVERYLKLLPEEGNDGYIRRS